MEHDDTSALRQQDFSCDGPIELWAELDSGRLDITLEEDTAPHGVAVRIHPHSTSQPAWHAGISGLLSWLGEQSGTTPLGELAAEAARHTVIEFTGGRLTVRTPREYPLRTVPLIIQVSAPPGSSINTRSGSADVTVTGVATSVTAATGSGQIRAQHCTGAVEVRTGSGDVRLGTVLGHVHARTGSGDLTVVDACAGGLELVSGSGQLRVGIHPGVRAELDVSSGCGHARSDLPVSAAPAEGNVALRVRARTGSGDALVTTAPS